MKRLSFLVLFIVLALIAGPAFAASGETVHVKVNGLVCEFCAKAIEKVFMKTEQTDSIDVDLDNALITIVMKEGRTFSDEAITKNITDAGYSVENIHHMQEPTNE